MLKPVETTPRARRTAVNARKQEKSSSQTKAARSNGVASEHNSHNGKKGERGRRHAKTGARGHDTRGRGTAKPARRRGGGPGKPSRAGTPKGAIPAAKLNGKPRSSIAVAEITRTIKATERDARRNGRPTAPATLPDLATLEADIKEGHIQFLASFRTSLGLARETVGQLLLTAC